MKNSMSDPSKLKSAIKSIILNSDNLLQSHQNQIGKILYIIMLVQLWNMLRDIHCEKQLAINNYAKFVFC